MVGQYEARKRHLKLRQLEALSGGVSYVSLQNWTRRGVLSNQAGKKGPFARRQYSFLNAVEASVMHHLLATGAEYELARQALAKIVERFLLHMELRRSLDQIECQNLTLIYWADHIGKLQGDFATADEVYKWKKNDSESRLLKRFGAVPIGRLEFDADYVIVQCMQSYMEFKELQKQKR